MEPKTTKEDPMKTSGPSHKLGGDVSSLPLNRLNSVKGIQLCGGWSCCEIKVIYWPNYGRLKGLQK